MEPYEIVAGPLELWLAPVGTTFPDIDAAPAGDWALIGTSGKENHSGDGVTITHSQTIEQARPGGTTGPVKAWRTEESLMIALVLWDMTVEQYRTALNGVSVATEAAGVGSAGTKTIGLSQGHEVTCYALLARGVSPYGSGFNAQYEVPRCYQSGSPAPVFRKGTPAALSLQFEALEDPNATSDSERFGRLVAQHQAALTE